MAVREAAGPIFHVFLHKRALCKASLDSAMEKEAESLGLPPAEMKGCAPSPAGVDRGMGAGFVPLGPHRTFPSGLRARCSSQIHPPQLPGGQSSAKGLSQ